MILRAFFLPFALAGVLGSVYFLPKAGEVAQSAANMDLPGSAGAWFFQHIPPSEAELNTLARDTKFSKAICHLARPGEITGDLLPTGHRLDFSLVLSGHDLNNSIHRPERCMRAQGHTLISSGNVDIRLPNGREFTVKRLLSVQRPPSNPDLAIQCVTYYFFVGHDRITHDHLGRTLIDMKDRVIHGLDQRWAYASASMWYGPLPGIDLEVSEEEADEKLSKFLIELADKQIDWDRIQS